MKKIALIIVLCMVTYYGFASTVISLPKAWLASEIIIPLFNSGKFISVEDFLKLTPKSYKLITGKKMRLKERVGLILGKNQLKRMISKDGTINIDKMKRGGFWGGFKWHWGGFAMGFFFSLLGPIIALFINDDYKWDRFWTALHTALYVWLLLGLLVLAFSSNIY